MVALPAMAEIVWKKAKTLQGGIALVVFVTLIIGFFLGSPVGRALCGIGVIGLLGYGVVVLRREGAFAAAEERAKNPKEDLYSQPDEGDMKTLLFDDFQPPSPAGYVVKEISEDDAVVPSTRSARPVATATEEKVREFDISDFFDMDSDVFRNESEPRSEFNFLLNKLLLAMKEVLFAHSVAFFWANREKQQLVLEAKATDSENFMLAKRYGIDEDVASQVARTGKPQVLGRISSLAEQELVRHYASAEGISSLIVVPVYYYASEGSGQQLPEGVIVADSKAEDAFGAETLALMGKFTKMISALIKSYTRKYDLLLDSELLSSIRRMQDRVKSERTESSVLNALSDEAIKLLNWDVLAVTLYSEELNAWAIQKLVNRTNTVYPDMNYPVEFSGTLVGRAINTNSVIHLQDLEAEPEARFSPEESILMRGSFLCVPISSLNRCYGALTIESAGKFQFTPAEAETLYRLVENAAELLEVLYMNDLVKEYIAVDQLTGSLNKKHFNKKLEEEVRRAEDFGLELSLVSIAVDNASEHLSRYGKEVFDGILHQVAKLIRMNIQPYDVIGRIDTATLNILLVNTPANAAYLWAEKVRKHIASNIVSIGGTSCSVTVSAGVCGLNDGMKKEELVAGTTQVLNKAIESGGNLVRVF